MSNTAGAYGEFNSEQLSKKPARPILDGKSAAQSRDRTRVLTSSSALRCAIDKSLQSTEATHMPLAGAILCFTSVPPEQRVRLTCRVFQTIANASPQTELGVIGAQMGAQVKLDLTSDVTHLIVGSTNSAKYRYVAKAREDVKVLLPEFIHALQKVWMEGEDAKVLELEEQWRLPTFFGLKICLTGFENRML